MDQYFTVFGQKKEDVEYVRYWVSISTEKMKDGKGTGKFANASIPARLSEDAQKIFAENAAKSKTKGVKFIRMKVSESFLMAASPKDEDMKDYVFIYIKKAEPAKQKNDQEDW